MDGDQAETLPDEWPLLAGFPVITELSVLWGDEDSFAHVNNVAYLRWCETARVEYLRRISLLRNCRRVAWARFWRV